MVSAQRKVMESPKLPLSFFPPLGILSEHSTFGPSEATDGPQHLNKSNNNNEV